MIYAHTSMFPDQLREPSPDSDPVIKACATEIIQAAHLILSQARYELRFIVFPLLMAGFATKDPAEKDLALSFIRTVERHSYGGSTESVRRLLETIYEKQRAATLQIGDCDCVHWMNEMELTGQRLVIYGL